MKCKQVDKGNFNTYESLVIDCITTFILLGEGLEDLLENPESLDLSTTAGWYSKVVDPDFTGSDLEGNPI